MLIIQGTLLAVGSSLSALGEDGLIQSYSIRGIIALNQGFIFTSMIWAAISVFLIDGEFLRGAAWSLAAAILSFFGIIHAFNISGNDVLNRFGWAAGWTHAVGYLAGAVVFMLASRLRQRMCSKES